MEQTTCETPGHQLRPGPYIIEGRRACRSCRNKHVRESDPNYIKKNPGPKPNPAKPNSRYNETSRHYGDRESVRRVVGRPRGEGYENSWRALGPVQCGNGHKWVEGSYKVRGDGKKICLICIDERKGDMCPVGQHPRTPENTGARGTCKLCGRVRQLAQRLMSKYGLTVEQFEDMILAQDMLCLICGDEFDFDKHNGVCVDHDHNCCAGETSCRECVRGILCGVCNTKLHDDIDWHLRAIDYLRNYQTARQLTDPDWGG